VNLFILHTDPVIAAKYYCDLHVPKLVVECYQMLGSAVRKHGATDEQMPLTQKGTPLVGGYPNHPVTIWVSKSRDNYRWTITHALALCSEFQKRFGKEHYCANGIEILNGLEHLIPEKYMADASGGVYQGTGLPIEKTGMTPFALAMPDESSNLTQQVMRPFKHTAATIIPKHSLNGIRGVLCLIGLTRNNRWWPHE
jgi:hypothetical protein